jgi:Domain of unknown function (DUF1707)
VTNLPEPGDRSRLRVSDADREHAAEMLRQAAGDGRLTLDELEQRLELAYAAKTYADLEPITRDLPAPSGATPGVSTARAPGAFPAERFGGTPSGTFSLAIMSGVRRTGPWVTIQAFAFMGGINIVVPEDIEVDVSGIGLMGGFDHRASGPGVPGAPRLRVVGFAMMGGVDVRRKPPKRQKRRDQEAVRDDQRRPIEG